MWIGIHGRFTASDVKYPGFVRSGESISPFFRRGNNIDFTGESRMRRETVGAAIITCG